MFAIQCIEVGNNLTEEIEDLMGASASGAFDWLSLQSKSTQATANAKTPPLFETNIYDIMARKLQQVPNSNESAERKAVDAWSGLRFDLFEIDAHLFSCIVAQIVCIEAKAKCRRCERNQTTLRELGMKMLFMTHTVALEGTARVYSGILDHICSACALMMLQTISAVYLQQGLPRPHSVRVCSTAASIRQLLRDDSTFARMTDSTFLQISYLLNGTVGFKIENVQKSELLVQGRFSSVQIEMQASQQNSVFLRDHHCQTIKRFLRCIRCAQSVLTGNDCATTGVLSTVYYDSARVFATPYFVCNACKCLWNSDTEQEKATRKNALIKLHQQAVRACFLEIISYFACVRAHTCGLGANVVDSESAKWAKIANGASVQRRVSVGTMFDACYGTESQSDADGVECGSVETPLVCQVESDILNKLFQLDKLEEKAVQACRPLFGAITGEKQKLLLKKCMCGECAIFNVLSLEAYHRETLEPSRNNDMLPTTSGQLESAVRNFIRNGSGAAATEHLPATHCSAFDNRNRAKKNRNNCSATRSTARVDDWRLPRKPFRRGHKFRCAHEFDFDENVVEFDFERFENETSHFLSPLF